MKKKIIFRISLPPGDVCAFTATLYSLHATYPGRFLTEARTPFPEIFLHWPYLTKLRDEESQILDLDYGGLLETSNQVSNHFLRGFCADAEKRLGVSLNLVMNRPHFYLSDEEQDPKWPKRHLGRAATEFWLVNAGIKKDFTAKQWPVEYYQQVINHFRGSFTFVQVGQESDEHSPLPGAVSLIGKTSLRDLICLSFHARGGLGPVTLLQHLCAAFQKPYVAILGGREPVSWTQYPLQQTLHTIGQLPCCRLGACWRSRVVQRGDNSLHDTSVCERPILTFRRPVAMCMTMVEPIDVIRTISNYYLGGAAVRRPVLPML